MPNFGLSKPYIAQYVKDGVYKSGFKCGKAVSTAVTPNYNEASCYGDNIQAEDVKEFKNASVALGVTTLPVVAKKVVFGHSVSEAQEEVSNSNDSANYVGYGFITAEMNDGVKTYGACVLLKVLFQEGEDSYETKGDSITFKTPTLSGTATTYENGDWRKKKTFSTEKEAEAYIEGILGITEQCEEPVFSVDAGTYAEAQTVTIATTTKGASIYYTTDGLTPTAETGTEYTDPVEISKSTLLKAIAVKAGANSSEVAMAEYIITA
ncbi:MAG: chitobiase/beta-hexosaminidase C-terminal domain-containing protein [Clostridiales bacterium]|nr:chitobiase/beta-hexosaminidase C-terminal domain-containing protein [Roseburia sp.]MDD7635316.1 chitobiase/beta-hexosaminidase C-terminal domain-containing protein [Clostridiales bacterium]MDY4113984.1 major tail protein [Roseburia sp.]